MGVQRPWLGALEYGDALALQGRLHRAGVSGGAPWLLGLEHRPVLTLGKRGGELDARRAAAAGYAVWQTRRGGLATCHEPGQLVGYVIVDARPLGVRRLVEAVEGVVIAWLGGRGIVATRRAGAPGVWVQGEGGLAKIAAVGLQVREGWSMHGFALNLVNDLAGFDLVSPCGIRDATVTSAARLGCAAPPAEAWAELGPALAHALGLADGAQIPLDASPPAR